MSRYLDTRRKTLPVAVTDVAEQLAEAGYKVTGLRLAVLRAAAAHQGAFSVHELEQWLTVCGVSHQGSPVSSARCGYSAISTCSSASTGWMSATATA